MLSLHLLLVLKQKHSMPGYARKLAEPGRVLGISALAVSRRCWPGSWCS